MSSGVPIRPSGMVRPRSRASSSVSGVVAMEPGAIAFTRMPYGARSSAVARVKASMPPLVASFGDIAAVGARGSTARHVDDAATLAARHEPGGAVGAQKHTLEIGSQHAVPPRLVTSQEVAGL